MRATFERTVGADVPQGIHIVDYDGRRSKDVAGDVIVLAKAENLPAHGEAVRRRFER